MDMMSNSICKILSKINIFINLQLFFHPEKRNAISEAHFCNSKKCFITDERRLEGKLLNISKNLTRTAKQAKNEKE